MHDLLSDSPKVVLTKAFLTPLENAVATARTCYSSRIIFDEEVSATEKARTLRDKIAHSTYQAGHHTTLQHAHFQFAMSKVSRHALWSFFHAHPFYNSEQVSQRYVTVKDGGYLVPQFSHTGVTERYLGAIKRQEAAYAKLNELLHPVCSEQYFEIYRGRRKDAAAPQWQNAIKKRCQEIARYILPIATHAHLYHTVSGLTLHRYQRLSESYDCPLEQKMIIRAMIDAVNELDPLFFKHIEDPHPLSATIEAQAFKRLELAPFDSDNAQAFARQFDHELGGLTSRLTSATPNADEVLAEAVRQILYVSKERLPNALALSLVLSPTENHYLGESLNLQSLGKLTKALDLVHFSFQKKISHSADSQAQRHRMLPGAKAVFSRTINLQEPDYITPELLKHPHAQAAKDLYDQVHAETWTDLRWLASEGVDAESFQYLLTNAFPIRYLDTGSLMDHLHKWTSRLCYNAQEEIWQATKDEVLQVIEHCPAIGRHILPPCGNRKISGHTPVCPEGERFCGVPVWKEEVKNFRRLL
jgi:thymidylate synthase ThyX